MKKGQMTILVIVIVALIAGLTNPKTDRHKEALKSRMEAYMQHKLEEKASGSDNLWASAGKAIGLSLGNIFVGQMVENMVTTDNYILFSTTKISWDGESRIIGMGAFGNVYISGKLEEELDKGILQGFEK